MSSAWRFGDKMIGQKFATKTRLPVFRNARTQLGESTNSFHFVLVFNFVSFFSSFLFFPFFFRRVHCPLVHFWFWRFFFLFSSWFVHSWWPWHRRWAGFLDLPAQLSSLLHGSSDQWRFSGHRPDKALVADWRRIPSGSDFRFASPDACNYVSEEALPTGFDFARFQPGVWCSQTSAPWWNLRPSPGELISWFGF